MSAREVLEVASTVIVALGGGGAIVFGLSSWLGRVWAERLLASDRQKYETELERLKTRLEHSVTVSRVQFDTEFQALTDIWATFDRLRASMLAIRPMTSVGPLDEDRDEALRRRFNVFAPMLNAFRQAVDERSPFYPEEIFAKLSEIVLIANREDLQVRTDLHRSFSSQWYDDGETNRKELLRLGDELSTAIRTRLATLAVVG